MEISKNYLEGRELRKAGKYDQAYASYQKAIQDGDVKGYYGLALLYEESDKEIDCTEIYSEHFPAIKLAALEGDYIAASIVGVYYAMGLGNIEQNPEQAHLWFLVGALGGDEVAQFNLAVNYYFGETVRQDHRKAIKWLEAAMSKNYEPAKALYDEINQLMNA